MEPYPDIDESGMLFQFYIAQRLEFRNLYNIDKLYPHQEFVRRFMSPYTPYKLLIMYHTLGSGKSIACIAVAIDHYLYDKKRCIIVTKGDSGSDNFEKQIEIYKNMCSRSDEWNKNKSIFTIKHYISLSNLLTNMTDENIKKSYSNKIFIFDEIHNVKYIKNIDSKMTITRKTSKGTHEVDMSSSVYGSIIRLLQCCTNIKVIMATATPMTDNPEQINSLLGICNYSRDNKKSMNGIISYNSSIKDKPDSIRLGTDDCIPGMTIYTSEMTGYQESVYRKEEALKRPKDIYRKLTHISLFCFDDETHGKDVTETKMKQVKTKTTITSMYDKHTKDIKHTRYYIKEKYAHLLKGEELKKCSSKYSKVIENLQKTEGNVFIFIEEVKGSGLLLLASILEHHGYELYLGEDLKNVEPKKRYTLCVGSSEICPNINDRLEGFNDKTNKNGQYVRILLGSKVIGESITLKNVRHFHCLTPHWNDSTIDQAVGRVVRNGSHVDLEKSERNVNIYIHASVFSDNPESSVDIKKLQKSKEKESKIQIVLNKMINKAVDKYCLINTEHNILIKYVINFSAAYLHNHIENIKTKISKIVSYSNITNINKLSEYLNINVTVLSEALCRLIYSNTKINDGFIRCWENSIFLVVDPSVPYVTLPDFNIGKPAAKNSIQHINIKFVDRISFINEFRYMSAKQKSLILENSITKNIKNILNCLYTLYINHEGILYHFLLYKSIDNSYTSTSPVPTKPSGKTRKFENNKWYFVESIEEEKIVFNTYKRIINNILNIADQKCIIYGIISTIDGDMRLRLRNTENKYKSFTDQRYIKRGKNMKSIKKNVLIEIFKNIETSSINVTNMSISEIVSIIDQSIIEKNLYVLI